MRETETKEQSMKVPTLDDVAAAYAAYAAARTEASRQEALRVATPYLQAEGITPVELLHRLNARHGRRQAAVHAADEAWAAERARRERLRRTGGAR
jgi:hypothetical protein